MGRYVINNSIYTVHRIVYELKIYKYGEDATRWVYALQTERIEKVSKNNKLFT